MLCARPLPRESAESHLVDDDAEDIVVLRSAVKVPSTVPIERLSTVAERAGPKDGFREAQLRKFGHHVV